MPPAATAVAAHGACALPIRAATPLPPRRLPRPARSSNGRGGAPLRRTPCPAAAGGPQESSPEVVAKADDLINKLLKADGSAQLSQMVAENLMAFDKKFWIRVAGRADSAPPAEKDRLASLASAVMSIVDAIVKKTDAQLIDSAEVLQEILVAAADERGEWHLPLEPERVASMRAALDARADRIDEALLSNAFAWMRKATDDKHDGMVRLVQKALQLYAARALATPPGGLPPDAADAALAAVADADVNAWPGLLAAAAEAGALNAASLGPALRTRMERVVLGLPSGSHAQRVQAEYLKELEARAVEAGLDVGTSGA